MHLHGPEELDSPLPGKDRRGGLALGDSSEERGLRRVAISALILNSSALFWSREERTQKRDGRWIAVWWIAAVIRSGGVP